MRKSNITAELTRRREFNQASPDESSCETRSRRSRPTICWAADWIYHTPSAIAYYLSLRSSTKSTCPNKFTRSYAQPLSAENFERYSVLRSLGENRHCLLDEFADAGNVKRVVVGFFAFPNFHHPDGVWIAGAFVDDIKDAAFGVFHQARSP